jgi:hypothetical protein
MNKNAPSVSRIKLRRMEPKMVNSDLNVPPVAIALEYDIKLKS